MNKENLEDSKNKIINEMAECMTINGSIPISKIRTCEKTGKNIYEYKGVNHMEILLKKNASKN